MKVSHFKSKRITVIIKKQQLLPLLIWKILVDGFGQMPTIVHMFNAIIFLFTAYQSENRYKDK